MDYKLRMVNLREAMLCPCNRATLSDVRLVRLAVAALKMIQFRI